MSRFIAAPGLLDRRVTSILTRRHVNSLECFWVILAAIGEPIAGCWFHLLDRSGSALLGLCEAGRWCAAGLLRHMF